MSQEWRPTQIHESLPDILPFPTTRVNSFIPIFLFLPLSKPSRSSQNCPTTIRHLPPLSPPPGRLRCIVEEGLSCSDGSRCHLLVPDTIILSSPYWDEETEVQGVVTQMLEVTQMVDGKTTLGLPVYLLPRTVLPLYTLQSLPILSSSSWGCGKGCVFISSLCLNLANTQNISIELN